MQGNSKRTIDVARKSENGLEFESKMVGEGRLLLSETWNVAQAEFCL